MTLFSQKTSGFTLIEIIVSLAIFSMVALVAIGAFLKIIDANKKSQSTKTAVNNLNFALESISREIRVGNKYNCGTNAGMYSFKPSAPYISNLLAVNCPGGPGNEGNVLAFNSSETKFVSGSTGPYCHLVYVYAYYNNSLWKAQQTSCDDQIAPNEFSPVVSADLKITDFAFNVTEGFSGGITVQPKVLIRVAAYAGVKEKVRTYFNLQTTVSQRIMN
jgi:prepilin-type N-terminal cleavage/methylation domain-containing protein